MRTIILSLAALILAGQAIAAETEGSKPPVPFTDEFLDDAHNVDAGRAIWEEQCQHCHGKKAYPGKAPKLRPAKLKPDFVYRRVTDGFR